jgi:DNA-binding HxlR family transcriptional regulator
MTGRLEPRGGWTAEGCSIDRAIQLLGTRSTLLILREAHYGTTRFEDFASRVGVSEPVAANRLRELVAEGLLVREPYREPGQRTREEYRLTAKGSDLVTAVTALMQWGDRWLAPAGGPVALRHEGCGGLVHAELRCERGHEPRSNELGLVAVRGRFASSQQPGTARAAPSTTAPPTTVTSTTAASTTAASTTATSTTAASTTEENRHA